MDRPGHASSTDLLPEQQVSIFFLPFLSNCVALLSGRPRSFLVSCHGLSPRNDRLKCGCVLGEALQYYVLIFQSLSELDGETFPEMASWWCNSFAGAPRCQWRKCHQGLMACLRLQNVRWDQRIIWRLGCCSVQLQPGVLINTIVCDGVQCRSTVMLQDRCLNTMPMTGLIGNKRWWSWGMICRKSSLPDLLKLPAMRCLA